MLAFSSLVFFLFGGFFDDGEGGLEKELKTGSWRLHRWRKDYGCIVRELGSPHMSCENCSANQEENFLIKGVSYFSNHLDIFQDGRLFFGHFLRSRVPQASNCYNILGLKNVFDVMRMRWVGS